MIVKGEIHDTLADLDQLFTSPSAGGKPDYYAKLATLELCGWIEETMDAIVLTCARKCCTKKPYIELVKTEIVMRT